MHDADAALGTAPSGKGAGIPPETYTRAEARRVIGIGPTKFWELEKAGLIKVRKIGTKGIVLRSDLLAFLHSLPSGQAEGEAA